MVGVIPNCRSNWLYFLFGDVCANEPKQSFDFWDIRLVVFLCEFYFHARVDRVLFGRIDVV